MARKESLRSYQEELLEKMERARQTETVDASLFLGFYVGQDKFLIEGTQVAEVASVTPIEPLPASKPWALGAANIRGVVLCITDFSLLQGGERIRKGKFLVLNQKTMPGAALMVEGISGLFGESEIGQSQPVPANRALPHWVSGCRLVYGQLHFMIDPTLFAEDNRFSKLQSGESA